MHTKRKHSLLTLAIICISIIVFTGVFIFSSFKNLPTQASYSATLETVLGKGWMTDADRSSDGQTIAISSSTGIWFYSADNLHNEQFYIPSDSAPVSSVALSDDSQYVVEGRWDNRVYVWSLADLSQSANVLRGHRGFVNDVAISPASSMVASASSDKTVRLWNIETGKLIQTLEGHQHSVTAIDFSPNGQLVASGSRDHTVKLWNTDTGELVQQFDDVDKAVVDVRIADDGIALIALYENQQRYIYDIVTGQTISVVSDDSETLNALFNGLQRDNIGFYPPVNTLEVSADGQQIAVGTGNIFTPDNRVLLWDIQTKHLIQSFQDESLGNVLTLTYQVDGTLLAIGDANGNLFLWNTLSDTLFNTWQAHNGELLSITFIDNQTLATGGKDGMIHVWDSATGDKLNTFESPNGAVHQIILDSSSTNLTQSSSLDNTLASYTVSEAEESLNLLCSHGDTTGAVSFNSDNTLRATATFDNKILMVDVATGNIQQTFTGHQNIVENLTFSHDGKWLASASWDKMVRVWNIETGEATQTLSGHTRPVTSVRFNTGNSQIISGSHDGTVRIWNLD